MAIPRKASKVNAKTINYAERRRSALMMRATRATYQQIADKYYNGNRSNCWKDIQKAFEDIPKEAAEEVRAQELELLDLMARGLIKKAATGDTKAVAAMLNIMQRRAKLLGLDEAVQIEATHVGASSFPIAINPNLLSDKALAVLAGEEATAK